MQTWSEIVSFRRLVEPHRLPKFRLTWPWSPSLHPGTRHWNRALFPCAFYEQPCLTQSWQSDHTQYSIHLWIQRSYLRSSYRYSSDSATTFARLHWLAFVSSARRTNLLIRLAFELLSSLFFSVIFGLMRCFKPSRTRPLFPTSTLILGWMRLTRPRSPTYVFCSSVLQWSDCPTWLDLSNFESVCLWKCIDASVGLFLPVGSWSFPTANRWEQQLFESLISSFDFQRAHDYSPYSWSS